MLRTTSLSKFVAVFVAIFGFMSLVTRPTHAADAPAKKLVIVKAVYGDLNSENKTDVTAKVAAMLKDNNLSVDATNDNFGDPAEGTQKKLQVDYTLDGAAHTRIVDEDQTMVITDKPSKLVVNKAFYGDLPDGSKTDVTEKVTSHQNGDSLSVAATNANFGDPAEGTLKKLTVEYTFDGKAKTKTVNEDETLTIAADTGE